jgi:hypothetical protein
MMRACCEVTRRLRIPTIVSLNSIMVDGTGMCGSCRVTVGGAMKFACVDGADFDGHLVNFDELALRQKRFEREEKQALERFRGESARLAAMSPRGSNGAHSSQSCPLPHCPNCPPPSRSRPARACPRISAPSPRCARTARSSRPRSAPTISKR